jgi:hypothetical protein
MSAKKYLVIVLALSCILSVACKASQELQNVTETVGSISNQEIVYPDDLLKFHIERQKGQAVFVLTTYKVPYHGHFQFMYLTNSDVFWIANDFSQLATRGGGHGDITLSEKENLIDTLDVISHSSMSTNQQGDYIFTLSYDTPDGVHVFSCQNMSCPVAICSIYELANAVIDRNQSLNNYSKVTCPIVSESPK